MKYASFAVVLMLSIPVIAVEGSPTLNLMPVPAQLELGEAGVEIGPNFSVTIEGAGATPRLRGGVQRMLRRLSDRSALFFDNSTFLQLEGRSLASMVVTANREGKLVLGEDESYRLTITPDGIALQAATDIGALRGIETFLQLLTLDDRGVTVPEIAIFDEPRFPWRGLMIDSSRHFMPVDMVKRNIDGMAAVKLNVLHWHLVDDQGFRVETLAWPKLHENASDGDYYTRAQIRDLIDYAAERGIRVVPEFDLPGHASAWLTAYPELASAPGPYEIERSWGIFDPTVNPTIERTYEFLDAFLAEMAELFDDEFIHIGGDENNGKHWLANPEIVAFMEDPRLRGSIDPAALFQRARSGHPDEVRQADDRVGRDLRGRPAEECCHPIVARAGIALRVRAPGLLRHPLQRLLHRPHPADGLPLPQRSSAGRLARDTRGGRPDPRWRGHHVGGVRLARDRRFADLAAHRRHRRTLLVPGQGPRRRGHVPADGSHSMILEELGLQHERNRPMMLRRLCQCRDVAALEVLLGAIEPVKVYNRGRLRKHTQFSPLTRMVDAAWPDAGPAREFRWAVRRLIESDFMDETDLEEVRSALLAWADNHAVLEETIRTSPALADIEAISINLAVVSSIGLEALDLGISRTAADRAWLDLRLDNLNAARESQGQAELMIIDPVVDLVCAVSLPASLTAEGCREKEEAAAGGEH